MSYRVSWMLFPFRGSPAFLCITPACADDVADDLPKPLLVKRVRGKFILARRTPEGLLKLAHRCLVQDVGTHLLPHIIEFGCQRVRPTGPCAGPWCSPFRHETHHLSAVAVRGPGDKKAPVAERPGRCGLGGRDSYARVTPVAWRPFGPFTTSKLTLSPSLRVL